ncbi:nuclear transport factor 2 family protein [Bradyrhizobium prioriisuperbiae]|uniref:nuclear transport factor 2 family protein n=1 Tax=Bradyrhizobium prioriisuperbiae TaxID=2854389 RepID=UPI0028F14DA2|nr:nuclear transport factor 2 family protein [Bradyrhizobium prioritasuperba]
MESSASKAAVMETWTAFASRNIEQIAAVFTPNAEWIAPKGNATAVALHHTDHMVGADQIARFIAVEMHKLFGSVDIQFRGVHADGSTVIVEERMQATLSNGNAYDVAYCFVFELEGRLIKRVREYMDTLQGWRMVFGSEALL